MTEQTIDRLAPPLALTAAERERARAAFAETPSLLDGPILAALQHIEHGERVADQILANVRGGTP